MLKKFYVRPARSRKVNFQGAVFFQRNLSCFDEFRVTSQHLAEGHAFIGLGHMVAGKRGGAGTGDAAALSSVGAGRSQTSVRQRATNRPSASRPLRDRASSTRTTPKVPFGNCKTLDT